MARSKSTYLRLYKEQPPQARRPDAPTPGSLPELLRAFQRVTGCPLQYVARTKETDPIGLTWSAPVSPGVGTTPGLLRLDPVGSAGAAIGSQVDPGAVRDLASALAGMLGELLDAQHALWQREAELAAGVPLIPQSEPEKHLAVRLQAILRGGAEAFASGAAAALYLLDEATTCLKLRSSWGLPPERLIDPPRPLDGALAELEALLGHAVVVDDRSRLPRWNPPEDFPTAVCVPVATPTTILGTLWIFFGRHRDFSDRETNLIEMVAGRVAAELEREMLLRVATGSAQFERQLAGAERLQQSQLPARPPLVDGWDVAGWTAQTEPLGGQFFDWVCLPKGLLALAVADADASAIEAALIASAVRAAFRAHAQHESDAGCLLHQIDLTLWAGSPGDQASSLFCGVLDSVTSALQYAVAGHLEVLLLGPEGWKSFGEAGSPLGADPDMLHDRTDLQLAPGQALLIMSGRRVPSVAKASPLIDAQFAQALLGQLALPAKDLLAVVRDRLAAQAGPASPATGTALVIKRNTA